MSTLLTKKRVNVIVIAIVLLLAGISTPVSAKQTRNKNRSPAVKRQTARHTEKTTAGKNIQKALPSKSRNASAARAGRVRPRISLPAAAMRNPGRSAVRSRISTGLQKARSPLRSITKQRPRLSSRLQPQNAFDAKKPRSSKTPAGKHRTRILNLLNRAGRADVKTRLSSGTDRTVSLPKTTLIADRIEADRSHVIRPSRTNKSARGNVVTGKSRFKNILRNNNKSERTRRTERIFNRPARQHTLESGSAVLRRTDRGTGFRRPNRTSKIIYEDRTGRNFHRNHYEHIYRDRHDRLCHRVIWPRYFFSVFYNFGSGIAVNYVYPYYRHRYVFVSLGGYWPFEYTYLRYYWYPSHLYYWYGYDPIARQLKGDTYNYYTYNYYTEDGSYSQEGNGTGWVDQNSFADVREKLARQQTPPDAETAADTYFDEAVKDFERADYAAAAQKFAAAMELAPEDIILPFALAQALFADEKHADAAGVIRAAMENITPEKEGVFYPRGLYVDENVLSYQIQLLSETAKLHFADRQMQLLLGYQLLGTGEIERSIGALTQAAADPQNAKAATVLLGLAEKIKAENAR